MGTLLYLIWNIRNKVIFYCHFMIGHRERTKTFFGEDYRIISILFVSFDNKSLFDFFQLLWKNTFF